MKREIKFRGISLESNSFIYGNYIEKIDPSIEKPIFWAALIHDRALSTVQVIKETVGQYTGLKDKNGVEIYEGDILIIKKPFRNTQTHTGDNIPLGSYTEPLEPCISEETFDVVFHKGCFCLNNGNDEPYPMLFEHIKYNIEDAKEGFAGMYYNYQTNGVWDCENEGDLQYLCFEYNLKDESELINYLGVEVVGSKHELKEALKELEI